MAHRGRWVLCIAAIGIALYGFAGVVLIELFLRRPQLPVPLVPGARDVQITARDGVPLRGWLLTPPDPSGNAVLVLHGSATNRASQLGLAKMFMGHGYTVLGPDNRGHGESGGEITTYGLLEADDVHRWVSWLIDDQHPRHVFGIGESLGGAVLIESLTAEPRFSAIVAESAFSSFERIARDRVAEQLPFGLEISRPLATPPVWVGLLYARLRYGFDLRAASPEDAIARSNTPVLLIHGLNDRQTPPEHSRILASRNRRSTTLWLVPGAGHTGAFGTAPQEFQDRVLGFFEAYQNLPRGIQEREK